MKTGYLAPKGLEEALAQELNGAALQYGSLFVMEGPPVKAHWAQNIWFDLQELSFQSISEAAKKLRALHGLWSYYPTQSIRRGTLIASQLPYFSPKPISFPAPAPEMPLGAIFINSSLGSGERGKIRSSRLPKAIVEDAIAEAEGRYDEAAAGRSPDEFMKVAPLGAWTLLDDHTLLAAPRTASPFADGEVHFQETKLPPSRAYLKLWELFTRTGRMPRVGERCLEIGASPGSWTWVLQKMGAEVIAVDRAPLGPQIAALPGISFLKKDAFSLSPNDFADIDWVFSDVVCYPAKLLEWIQPWLSTGANLVCTIKFQGNADYGIIREFEAIAGSSLIHLFHNKHELTWVRG
jgi:hypothetical protein